MRKSKIERINQRRKDERDKLMRERFCAGTSKAASRRREERTRGVLHSTHTPGDRVKMSRGREYFVASDGAYQRLAA